MIARILTVLGFVGVMIGLYLNIRESWHAATLAWNATTTVWIAAYIMKE